jgi:hypothetical protein
MYTKGCFMQKSMFKPWIGEKYSTFGLYGKRILFLGESHYGEKGKETEDKTIRVVERLGLCEERCHRFFTTIAKFSLFKGAKKKISLEERRCFWDRVAFYNYVQEFVADKARKCPTSAMWESSKKSFLDVIDDLQPDLIVVLGKRLYAHLPVSELSNTIELIAVKHPSGGLKYAESIPAFQKALKQITANYHQVKECCI